MDLILLSVIKTARYVNCSHTGNYDLCNGTTLEDDDVQCLNCPHGCSMDTDALAKEAYNKWKSD